MLKKKKKFENLKIYKDFFEIFPLNIWKLCSAAEKII